EGYPGVVNWMWQVFDPPSAIDQALHAATHLVEEWLHRDVESDLSGYISNMFGSCELSAGLLPMLGMGRDIPDGRMSLHDNMLNLDWIKQKSSHYFDRLREKMIAIANALGANFVDSTI